MDIRLVLLLVVHVTGFFLDQSEVHIYVSPTGSDANDGLHVNKPFRTLHKTMQLVKSVQHGNMNIYVELLQGYHDLTSTLNVNHHLKTLTFRAYNGQEVHVTGGKRIAGHSFSSVTDQTILNRLPAVSRSKVKVIHLPAVGVTNYGSISEYGFYRERTAMLEVFLNGEPLRLARWPNEGFINVVGTPDGTTGRRFTYNSDEPAKWTNETEAWAYGYWYWSWADRSVPISSIDSAAKLITLAQNPLFGLRTGSWNDDPVQNGQVGYTHQGGYFRVINVLSELDQPGEYFVDKKTGNLYVWFPSNDGEVTSTDVIYVSLLHDCIHLNRHTSNVVFEDFTIEGCRRNGIFGAYVSNITIKSMEVKNTGGYNVNFHGTCNYVTMTRSYLHAGDGGISITGGTRSTLISSGNLISDNEFWRYSREGAVGSNAVNVGGVGIVTSHNYMSIGQYDAIRYSGNDHIVEFNNIGYSCMNSTDCGAIMSGRDWTNRGNTFRSNYIHHTLHLVPGADNRGIMLDDQMSGAIIHDNVFYDNHVHVNIGGGRDNYVTDNVMYNATSYSMQVDSRGTSHSNDADLLRHLNAVPYTSTLWTTRYPHLVGFDSANKSLPEGNQIVRNVIYNTAHKETVHGMSGWKSDPRYFNVTDNVWAYGPSDFFSPSNEDFRFRCLTQELASDVGIHQPLSKKNIGPRFRTGPAYLHRAIQQVSTSVPSVPCSTAAPASKAPVGSYIPDGSAQNTLHNVSNQGCWFIISGCTNTPAAIGTYRDTYGEQHVNAANNESACLQRGAAQWKYCGAHNGETVTVVYGPSGAMTIVGDGCFLAMYGCPNHGGPADGHTINGNIHRDAYAEQHDNAAHSEHACLARAFPQWRYCGSHPNHPVTSLYRPTGHMVTAGAGCWIHVLKCPGHPQPRTMFYDDWGATNMNTDENEYACLNRARMFWSSCGSDPAYPVTAHYRPRAVSRTVP